jgi:hypothetical protein
MNKQRGIRTRRGQGGIMKNDPSFLFTLRFRLSGGTLTIKAWEGPSVGPYHTRIDVEASWGGFKLFPRGATYCGLPRFYSLDGANAKELVGSLLAMKPGDTDSEYFASYTPEQLAWAEQYSEELSCEVQARYCDENGAVRS